MTETRLTIAQFIERLGISMDCTFADRNPNMVDDGRMDHWRCKLQRKDGGRQSTMSIYFSMGVAHKGARPEADDVLSCLASDSASVENAKDFGDWCTEYGYNAESRNAARIYRACKRQSEKLKQFLGTDAYETLLWNTEWL